uniref:Protein tyrosine phosphatase (ARSC2, arsC) n=1 Tax=uncultured marine group II/III euryarchaeote KM3_189_C01 TaxID=1457954 RepID=A0A075GPQ3_9EURY|nr:protein tyrosine phosphatase (ARSC2, arsC) [uncultured marine group II/III euryarchaeote KM3_189_C01]
MAEGWAKYHGLEAQSAGTHPGQSVAKKAIEVMAEKGIDISNQVPTNINDVDTESFDLIFSMGCGVSCPNLKFNDDWKLDDPYGGVLEKYQEIRDEIESNVRHLVE